MNSWVLVIRRLSLLPTPPVRERRASAAKSTGLPRSRPNGTGGDPTVQVAPAQFPPPFSHEPSSVRHTSHAPAHRGGGRRRPGQRKRKTPARKIQTQTLGDDATVATAAADTAGLVPADLERRVMAAVKASEARGDPTLLRAVELSRVVAGEGAGAGPIPSAELAGILVSNLCFAHNSPSLWKLLGQAVASRLLCPLHVLALLTPRCARPPRPPLPPRAEIGAPLWALRSPSPWASVTHPAVGFVTGCCRSGERSLRRIGCTWSSSSATSRRRRCLWRLGLIVTSKTSTRKFATTSTMCDLVLALL